MSTENQNQPELEDTKAITPPENAADTDTSKTAEKTYSQDELNDLRVQWEAELQEKAAQKADEEKKAEEFAKLSENEKIIKRAEAAEADAAQLREQLAQKELDEYAIKQLTTKALSADALSFIHGKDSKAIDAEVAALETFITAEAQKRVEERIKGSQHVPFSNTGVTSIAATMPCSSRGVQRID